MPDTPWPFADLPTVASLADLPLGWTASRSSPLAPWNRQPQEPA